MSHVTCSKGHLKCTGLYRITHRLRSCQNTRLTRWRGQTDMNCEADLCSCSSLTISASPANGLKKTFASVCFMSSESYSVTNNTSSIPLASFWEQIALWWMFLRTPSKNGESETKYQTWGSLARSQNIRDEWYLLDQASLSFFPLYNKQWFISCILSMFIKN